MAKLLNTVSVLGVNYAVYQDKDLASCDGYCQRYNHEIHIRKAKRMLDGKESTQEEKEARYREVMRHELIHAFFNVAGLEKYGYDETLVNFLSAVYPHMTRVFEEMGCDKE